MTRARALCCAALLALPGCLSISASSALGPRVSPAALARIVPGESTLAEVLAELGPPEEFLRPELVNALGDDAVRLSGALRLGNRGHDVLTWQHDRLDARGRWWLLYLWLEMDVQSDVLMIRFDARDRVLDVSYRRASHG